jgi:signal transduction histidine kinase
VVTGIAHWLSVRGERLPRVSHTPGRDATECRYQLERTLHDDVAIRMAALVLKLGVIAQSAGDPRVSAELDAVRDVLCQVVDDLRDIGAAIYPPLLAGSGLGPALRSVAERRDLSLRLDLPRHDLGAEARSRTALFVVDHLHRLEPGTSVTVRVRGRRFVRVHITGERTGRFGRRRHWAVLRCE